MLHPIDIEKSNNNIKRTIPTTENDKLVELTKREENLAANIYKHNNNKTQQTNNARRTNANKQITKSIMY